jgi:hypothetical protein
LAYLGPGIRTLAFGMMQQVFIIVMMIEKEGKIIRFDSIRTLRTYYLALVPLRSFEPSMSLRINSACTLDPFAMKTL